jgi:hypothetical protein
MQTVVETVLCCWFSLGLIGFYMLAGAGGWGETSKIWRTNPSQMIMYFFIGLFGGVFTFAIGFVMRLIMSFFKR